MKTLCSLLLCCLMFASLQGYSNAAQPGIFDAGGTGNFILIYPGDSDAFRKIQMVDEHIAIQLYRGFAVVRGEYKMYNTADSTLSIKVGYPVNSMLRSKAEGSTATDIFFDQLYALKSYTNGRENQLIKQEGAQRMSLEENNWYIWESTFNPHDTTTLVVYFVVNTNNTAIREGYTVDRNNGFVYLLETGATWKQPIVKGEIKIALMDELKISDIKGVSPCCVLRVNEMNNTMRYNFAELSPTVENNIVIVYTPNLEKFDFGYISQKRQLLFGSIDSFAKQPFDESGLVQHSFPSPYKVHTVSVKNVAGVFVILGITILILIVLLLLLRFLIRKIRDSRPPRGTEI